MCDSQMFQVANPLDRFAIGDCDELAGNGEGSLTLCIQHESPGKDEEGSWLPAPNSGGMVTHNHRQPTLQQTPIPFLRWRRDQALARAVRGPIRIGSRLAERPPTPVGQGFRAFREGLKAVPSGPRVVEIAAFPQVTGCFW